VYHVFARGNNRQRIYRDHTDYLTYLRMLGLVVARMRWSCLAYCLMSNHVHLLIETRKPNLGAGMRWLQTSYAQRFNKRHGRSGHVFQGRFGSVPVERDEQLLHVVGYIARNPVEARLCTEPEQWPWSSYRDVVLATPPQWLDVARLFGYLGALGGEPQLRYAALAGQR
jgi:putative transposase